LPAPLAYGAALRSGVALEIYGGTDGERVYHDIWRLEAGKNAWTQAGKVPTDTLLGRAERSDGRVYLFGGCSDVVDLTRCNDAVQVRQADGAWRKISAMPQGALSMPASAVVRGKVYLFGGCVMPEKGKLINRADAYSFDPQARRWTRLNPLPRANRALTAAAWEDRYVLLFGGYTASEEEAAGKPTDFGFAATVLAYDVTTGNYTEMASLPLPVSEMEMLIQGDQIFGIGGEHRNRDRTARLVAARLRRE
jgi:N-acetylneuraminic acid mutarotase